MAFGRVALFLAALGLAYIVVDLGLGGMSQIAGALGIRLVVWPWTELGAALIAHAICLRLVDRQPWSAVGLGPVKDVGMVAAFGFGGVVLVGVPVAALIGVGWLRVAPADPGSWWSAAAGAAWTLAPAAAAEELFSRGYIFSLVRGVSGAAIAIAVTSIGFGVLHLGNQGVTAQSFIAVVVAGVLLGATVVYTGTLYTAIAMHFTWNWIQVAVLHTPVSGFTSATPGYAIVPDGPVWATGGTWGPEAGIPVIIAAGLAGLWLLRSIRSRVAAAPIAGTAE